ncbi:glycosyltransferase [Kriegella aquimaris]|uniref:Glycosyltransferase involved in cell wall bisynthesis n=1 Tax=Kriegella aquimaris TaxID=192904 RepID=A0A1G9JSQ9_9FLAO|nr:glycosyltransferase [Kriegella aquimaris]SDL40214.1 Glycosyltransferase involved in cell wall bisynthesis [Kriegella aquimaris]
MKNKICCIFNIGSHYRESIYTLMDQELQCDFYMGDTVFKPLKTMDYNSLKGYRKTIKNKKSIIKGYIWQQGVWRLVFKPYKSYIINSSPYYLSNWIVLILAKILGKKTYAWTHGIKGSSSKKQMILQKNFYRLFDKIFLYGDQGQRLMIEQGFDKDKLVLLYNSLDYKKQLVVRNKLKPSDVYKKYFNNDFPVLIYIGRIQTSKKVNLLVEALKNLREKDIPCNLVVVGEDIDDNDIPKLVKKYNIDKNVWFYGPCYKEELIGPLLYNADVCVSPGLIGLTAIHSLTYGTPVITSDNFYGHGPEFEAIKPGLTGDFFEEGNLDDLVLKINNWINLDKSSRNKTRLEAYRLVDDKYNPFYQINVLKKVLQS